MKDAYCKTDNSIQVVARLMRLFRRHSGWLFVACGASLLNGFSAILMAKGIEGVTNAAQTHSLGTLYGFLYYILAAMAAGVFSSVVTSYASGRYSDLCMVTLRNRCQEHVASLSMPCMDGNRSGDLLSRMTQDVNEIEWFLSFVVINSVTSAIILVTSLSYMFVINWKLTLLSSICVPAFTVLVAAASKKLENQMTQQQESLGSESNILEDSFMGLSELKAFGLKKMLYDRYCREVDNTTLKSQQMYKTECKIIPVGNICSMLPLLVTMFFGGYLIVKGAMKLSGLLAYISLSNNVTDPLNQLQRLITALRTSVACIRRIFEAWNYPQERTDGERFPDNGPEDAPAIEFDKVGFRYDADNGLFQGLSFQIGRGEKVALVGSSGCGKSTVLKLITDFYQADSGAVRIFGHDIREWNIGALRDRMAEVLQDNYLFPDTIRRNIAYGKPDAPIEEVERAAKQASIYDFIQELPNKYETPVGERGVRLSGGQRQRVAIARALLKDAPILLLDEATSALDTESEKEVQAALDTLMADRTTLVIAHRLSTIRNADRILVMDEGRIVETGTHDELVSRPSVYRQLYNKQFRDDENGFCLAGAQEGGK